MRTDQETRQHACELSAKSGLSCLILLLLCHGCLPADAAPQEVGVQAQAMMNEDSD